MRDLLAWLTLCATTLALVSGCASEAELANCSALAPPPTFDVFLLSESLSVDAYGRIPERALRGKVTAAGDGAPADCTSFDDCIALMPSTPRLPSDGYWFQLIDDQDGSEWTLSISIPDHARPVGVGDTISVEFSREPFDFSPPQVRFRLDVGGVPVVAVQRGGQLADLELTDIADLSKGSAVCATGDDCLLWRYYDVDVATQETRGVLKYGGELTVGDWRLLHGGFSRETGVVGTCLDAYVARAIIAAVRLP